MRLLERTSYDLLRKRAAENVLFCHVSYINDLKDVESVTPYLLDRPLKLLWATDYDPDYSKHQYQCKVFLDEANKTVIFANAGSRYEPLPAVLSDLWQAFKLFFWTQAPSQIEQAKNLNMQILNALLDEGKYIKDYKIVYTGHSSGALKATIAAAHMDITLQNLGIKPNNPEQPQVSVMTFENPGAKVFVDALYRESGYGLTDPRNIECINFNNRKNPINTLFQQAGDTYKIEPYNQKPLIYSFAGKIMDVCAKVSSYLGYFGISKICEFFAMGPKAIGEDHALVRFEEIFVLNRGEITPDNSNADISFGSNNMPMGFQEFSECTGYC